MPVAEIIEMVAGLLTKITTTNDRQHEFIHRHIPPADSSNQMNSQTTSVLAFHGKNVPSISILSYLSRIHKYCPTTYEVFLSLLVYFDRMTERVNAGPMVSLRQANQQSLDRLHASQNTSPTSSTFSSHRAFESQVVHTPPNSGSSGRPADMTSASAALSGQHHTPAAGAASPPSPPMYASLDSDASAHLSQFFVVDSFNIHRLVIAGVTCASKFFSDIFYTNSRYAKVSDFKIWVYKPYWRYEMQVGGLPLNELNHLELQFLILNDFRLAVPLEEMEAYGTMLVEFYAREVLAQQHPPIGHGRSLASMTEWKSGLPTRRNCLMGMWLPSNGLWSWEAS
jgi:PHO85 cyclin-6/7